MKWADYAVFIDGSQAQLDSSVWALVAGYNGVATGFAPDYQ